MNHTNLINEFTEIEEQIKNSADIAEMAGASQIALKLREDMLMVPHAYKVLLEDEGYDKSKAEIALRGLRVRVNNLMKDVQVYQGA